jgi:hypothetical protein
MKRNKTYIGKNTRWFMDYLPNVVFNKLSEKDRKHYREYRRYQRYIGESQERIQKLRSQIEKIKQQISDERIKIDGDGKGNDGWKYKQKMYYDEVSYLNKKFKFSCTIEFRDRSSKSLKKKLKDDGGGQFSYRTTYGKKGIKPVILLYSNIVTTSFRKSIYLGKEDVVRDRIGNLYNEDITNDSREILLDDYLRPLLCQYSRYHIHSKGWDWFRERTHNLDTITKWGVKLGDDRYDWGGTI